MTTTLTPVDITTDNWIDFIAKANNIFDALETIVVTVDQPTVGDATIVGSLTTNNIIIDTAMSNSGTITVNSNINVTNGSYIGATTVAVNGVNVTANSSALIIQGAGGVSMGASATVSRSVNIGTATPTIVHQFPKNSFTTGKYTLSVSSTNGVASGEILLMNDGNNNVIVTEYAMLNSNGSLGTFSANNASANTRLYFTPLQANNNVKMHVILVGS